MGRPVAATLEQLITSAQRRWGARALRRLGHGTPPAVAVLPTGFAALDAALGIGGLPRGRLTELLGMPTSGAGTLALTLLAQAQAQGDLAGYIDLSRTFDAEIAALLGVDLAALLLVRPTSAADALEIMLALVGSGGLGALVVDALAIMQGNARDAPLLEQALRGLPALLSAAPTALVALTPLPYPPAFTRTLAFAGSLVGHAAALRLHVAREGWLPAAHGPPGCHARISVLKHQLAPAGGDAQVLIPFPDEAVP